MRPDLQIQINNSKVVKIILIMVVIFIAFSLISFGVLLGGKSASDWLTAYMTYYLAIATIVLAMATVIVIWWQGGLLKRQLELQVITDLYKEWNKQEMLDARIKLCEILTIDGKIDVDNLNYVEEVIEFLERIASYYANEVLSKKLVWDTFSWYITRYYYYTQQAIPLIEEKWGSKEYPDRTLYKDLRELYEDLMKEEERKRKEYDPRINQKLIETDFKNHLDEFKKSEGYEIPV